MAANVDVSHWRKTRFIQVHMEVYCAETQQNSSVLLTASITITGLRYFRQGLFCQSPVCLSRHCHLLVKLNIALISHQVGANELLARCYDANYCNNKNKNKKMMWEKKDSIFPKLFSHVCCYQYISFVLLVYLSLSNNYGYTYFWHLFNETFPTLCYIQQIKTRSRS